MSTAAYPGKALQPIKQQMVLRLALYDRVASMVISMLIIFGLVSVLLFSMWLSLQAFGSRPAEPDLPIIEEFLGGGSPEGTFGESMKIDSPHKDLIAKETNLNEPEIQDTVTSVLDAVVSIQPDMSQPVLYTEPTVASGGLSGPSQGTGNRVGLGDGGPGPGYGFSRANRWVIQFSEGGTLDQYGKQLAFFGIELGAVYADGRVEYAFDLDKPVPARKSGTGKAEKRLYFSWQNGSLRLADRKLLTKAGVDISSAVGTVQLFTPGRENELAHLELNFAKRPAAEIRRTRFGVRPVANGYAFYVIDQTYLK